MKRSFIREILDHTTNETISFAGGLPDEKLFPNKQLSKSANRVLLNTNSLQYIASTGLQELKEKISQFYCEDGFPTKPSNILITSGSQQALDIISRYNCGKDITIESPSYLGAMNIFDLNNIKQDAVKLRDDGIDIEKFENSFSKTKLSYLIPDFQNPTGYSYSLDKRDTISKIVKSYNGILIEDSPYGELYFKEKYKSISSMIPDNSFSLGSFSKTLAPSLRIGWIRANEDLLAPLIAYKEAMDLHTNGLSQYILNDYLEDKKQYQEHLNILRKTYTKKMEIFTSHLDKILPEFSYVEPKGGMFIYGSFKGINTSDLVQKCLEENVVFVPGIEFYTKNSTTAINEIRFNFTHSSPDDIYKGLTLMSKIIKEL